MLARKAVRGKLPLPSPLRKAVQSIAIATVRLPVVSTLVGYRPVGKTEEDASLPKVEKADSAAAKPPAPLSKVHACGFSVPTVEPLADV